MKAVINNRIFLTIRDAKHRKEVEDALTYQLEPEFFGALPKVIRTYKVVSPTILSIPSGRVDLIPDDYTIIDKRVVNPVKWPENTSPITLRESQQFVYDNLDSSAIINAPVSWGKTFTALQIAKKLGQKTLVITHTTALRDQWAESVEKMFGIKPSIIGGGKVDTSGFVTIANVQTLKKHISSIKELYGTTILDEMHHVSASTFSDCINTMQSKYKIGLSGTLERKDQMHCVFNDYFGFKIFKPAAENYMFPSVLLVQSSVELAPNTGEDLVWANLITDLNYNAKYRQEVVDTIKAVMEAGHQFLYVSDRVDMLKFLAEECFPENSVLVTGETKQEDRAYRIQEVLNGEKCGIFGSVNIFSEGISVNPLSCLILGIQTNNIPLLTQLIGRVTRIHPNKQQPLIVDLVLRGGISKKQFKERFNHYVKSGYTWKRAVLN